MSARHHEPDEDVIQLDLYLDRLLTGAPPRTDDRAIPVETDLREAADLLGAALVRFHPSFRFEERLARRLRDAALDTEVVDLARDAAADAARHATHARAPMGVVIPLGIAPATPAVSATRALLGRLGPDRSRGRRVGGAILGGAIASGVSIASLAGAAALVAWRRGRSDTGWERVL